MFSSQVQESRVTETKINEAREHYRPAAARASLLYFIMSDLHTIHPMYQFSLKVPPHGCRGQYRCCFVLLRFRVVILGLLGIFEVSNKKDDLT